MPTPATLPDTMDLVKSLGTALGLGLLVGLQREWVQNRVAGIRTFGLLSLFGALTGLLGLAFGAWVVAAALVAFASLVVAGNLAEWKAREPDSGLTTEMAMLVMFAVGMICLLGERLVAVIIAGTVMVLLQSKKPLHQMVRRIGEDDLREIARLVLAGLVILPVLPNRGMGYLGVLNPFAIWLMVVLIIGISLAAYLAGKFLGGDKGSAVSGILGGLISSTATTASLARRSRVAGSNGLSLAAVAYRLSRKSGVASFNEQAPSELKSAVLFGLLYAVVLVIVAAAREHFGNSGLYVAAALSGLTDVDAITLSTSRLVTTAHLDTSTAWRMILLGGLANVVFKMGLVVALGARPFIRPALIGLGTALAGGAAVLIFWP